MQPHLDCLDPQDSPSPTRIEIAIHGSKHGPRPLTRPSFDGVSSFKDYRIRARLWLATTKAKPKTRGPFLLKNLTGTAFDNFKYLATEDSWLNDVNNGQLLLDLMNTREYYGDDAREDMLHCLGKLTYQMKRGKQEGQKDFCARRDLAVRRVSEHGVKLPPEYLGFLFIMALQLDPQEVKLLMNYCKGSLNVTDVKEWLRVHETVGIKDLSKNSDKKSVLLTETTDEVFNMEADVDEGEDSEYEVLLTAAASLGVETEEEETFDEEEAKEILATMVREPERLFCSSLNLSSFDRRTKEKDPLRQLQADRALAQRVPGQELGQGSAIP